MRFGKLLALLLALGGCDCNRTISQAQARHVMVATVLATPAFSVPYEGIAGLPFFDGGIPSFDGGIPGFDGGCPFDGGCVFDAGTLPIHLGSGGLEVKPQTLLATFFGNREGDSLAAPPVPVEGATVKATGAAMSWTLQSQGSGFHTLTSADDATLVYDAGITFSFTGTDMGADFTGAVNDTPKSEAISQLHPDAGYIALAAGSEYVLTRPDPEPGDQRLLGFVTVIPISVEGDQGAVTYSNIPQTPLEFLKLVAAPSQWRTTLVTIPPRAFPQPDRNYVILFQSAKLGGPSTDNLFIGSAVIAGVADVGVVKTH